MPDLPILDPQPLRDLLDLGAGEELIQELLDLLREDIPPRIAAIRLAMTQADYDRVIQDAHQMKGALGNLGLKQMADLATRLEAAARAGRGTEAGQLAEQLPAAYEAGLKALLAAFPQA